MRLPPAALAALALLGPALAAPGPAPGLAAWDVLPDLPAPRQEVAAAAAGGEVYVLGGLGDGAVDLLAAGLRVEAYDPAARAWRQAPPLPVPLHHTAVVALGPRLVVLGGYTGPFVPLAATWVLDTSLPPAQQAWVPFVPLPTPRGAHAAATDGARIWVFGGGSPATLDPTVWVLEPAAPPLPPAWRRLADLPEPREHLAGAFLDGKVYAAGGRKLSLATNSARLDAYDPAADAWVRGPDMPTRRGGIAAAAAGGLVVVFGGEAAGGTFDAAEAFDPAAGAWRVLPPMPHARHGLGAAALDGAIYVEAGGPDPGLSVGGANERLRLG